MKTVRLPETLKVVGDNAFEKLWATAIYLPADLQSIGSKAFLDCNFAILFYPLTMDEFYDRVSCGEDWNYGVYAIGWENTPPDLDER